MNFQMPPGSPPESWLNTIRNEAVPKLEAFAPDMLLLSAGFDGHRLDPLGNQLLEAEHYGEITRMIKHIANGKIVSFLEGGYHLTALGQCVVSHVKALQE
jgi:acetoin utilization deacetylase AcuC-like enzyme